MIFFCHEPAWLRNNNAKSIPAIYASILSLPHTPLHSGVAFSAAPILFRSANSGNNSVGGHFIYGSWYNRSELGTRAAVFCCFGHLGSMAGGWIQAGLLKSPDGHGSLAAWRWLFIIVSILTNPVVVFGWLVIPNLPTRKSAWFLTDQEKQRAIDRG
ncbi:hypothetical protein B0T10DRAFT_467637 [Thelonectria olida]|uniref:Major facilitator superfamily (MFS) profile domain-containing protein n=1 Tax=Thelonectria olida TaxID=1576542 RepID=A0A9P8VPJ1_9HYPO|nr:hypothetical protein B0T10DRAFT_467637 [Thelonectria olida]